jgi:threonylcarbamoyladenosine tRNA methylthiotransferase MtaB
MSDACFRIHTLGCRVNQYESGKLREKLLALGLAEAAPGVPAGLVVVNSCAVTAGAVADTRQLARKAAAESPSARIILTGCAASAARDELAKNPPPGEILPGRAERVADLLGGAPAKAKAESPQPGRSRAVLKVQDGCSAACAFCIVPRARGGPSSKHPDEAAAEALSLARAGYAEIVVSGVNLGQYQTPEGLDFWDLVARLDAALAGEFGHGARLRLSSLDPGLLHDKALAVLSRAKLVAPHLHLSLQSGDARTLARMRRSNYTPEGVAAWLARYGQAKPVFGLGADLLAGFPGETDEEFAATLRFVERLPLTYAHVFPYSPRPGTLARAMGDKVAPETAKGRAALLRELASRRKKAFAKAVSALPELTMVVEEGAPVRGVCEYYLECELAGQDPAPAPGPAPGQRIRAVPAGVRGATVLVKPAP